MIKDIIWDFDGILFDTYPGTVNAFILALKDSGIEETSENVLNCLKISDSYAVTYFKKLYDLDEAFNDKYNAYKKDIKPEMIRPFQFAKEVCRQFTALGGRNYIITHRGESTLKFLEHYSMRKHFTEIVTKQYGFKRKPDPEAFIYLIEKYKINKSSAMVIGDRECEILGGKSAGISTCLYNTNNVKISTEPDFYIESLEEIINIID
ncbi:phosphoglycolate phosphatase-like HAD superfamily hydrolase [Clostridium saccharoperbutylacetonicum]|uniref:HAD-superfamily hydrolase, subfamily IA, variant 1 n=1 Tax=Clostridium saccharoperbutylacetonicum N1-4(HMT) TaxID=931276 RepID=M1ME10_9CLOT|nr:HAD-IA family hydrolase [Clostridium saccharoperbutylacetonicum]AGF56154.1 HAD-superfamily hydrolase, subfamily IA, variant 1 [Clostridium saccharoperbutylacetonicum N1-4(HMT)]NRT63105.1 phosphoglycolate phosphatase-like HAD superfamily hydrolase [Clostridium saccharoperbutylacetonicum]NSB26462.1 phosphoglycolate phosphatase-like HAD superfamily hydrolase [Clostridium saccharoperbutylacetonicum]NSB45815.1 phosphoglycolate phosphatase-like HAD superfamily hydrolase [Clostridium saccharoperbut